MLLEPGALAAPSLKSHQCNASTWAWNLAMGMVHEKSPARKLLGVCRKNAIRWTAICVCRAGWLDSGRDRRGHKVLPYILSVF